MSINLKRAVGRQSALHKENSRFATPTLGRHISTFRGYQILFSIQNPYINRFTNHFSNHLPWYIAVIIVFSKSRDKWLKKKLKWRNDRVYVKIVLYSSVTPLSEGKMVMPTHFVLFPSALNWAVKSVDGTICPAEYALYCLPCDLYVVYLCK
jgi:hypothetical protein